jgi:hypothetical protein
MNSARFLAAAAAQVITLAAGEQRFRQSSVSWRTVLFFFTFLFCAVTSCRAEESMRAAAL